MNLLYSFNCSGLEHQESLWLTHGERCSKDSWNVTPHPSIIRLTSSHTPSIIHTMLCQHTHGIPWQPTVIIFTCCTSVIGKKMLQTQHKGWQMQWKAGLLLVNGYNSFQTVNNNSELRRTPWCHKSDTSGIKSISSNDRQKKTEALFLVFGGFIYSGSLCSGFYSK